VKREEEFSDRLNNQATFRGCTALHYAVLADSITCVKTLLDGGANPTVENEAGHRAIEYTKNGEIKQMLIQHAIKYDEITKEKVLLLKCSLRHCAKHLKKLQKKNNFHIINKNFYLGSRRAS
jgi:ankyrin repeat protein